jgi:CPA1 family monovalent cation:H+ antiporter
LPDLDLPHRLVNTLESESLANDATGLVVYRFAVAAAISGHFSPGGALAAMALASVGGAAFGFLVAFLLGRLQRHLDDPPAEIALQLMAAYLAYLPAQQLGLSGVFAAATAGLYSGWISPTVLRSRTRLWATAYWDTTEFLLNGLLFLLLGLQIKLILTDPHLPPLRAILRSAAMVMGATIAIRLAWVAISYVLEAAFRRPSLSPKAAGLLGWIGLRGVLSLATALALPFELAPGVPFPGRRLIILLAFSVILATLVLQGLSLPALIRRLMLREDNPHGEQEVAARLQALRAAHLRLASLIGTLAGPEIPAAGELRRRLELQLEQLGAPSRSPVRERLTATAEREAFYRLRRELIAAQREELLALRGTGQLDDHSLRRIERELDLDEIRR